MSEYCPNCGRAFDTIIGFVGHMMRCEPIADDTDTENLDTPSE